MSSLEIRSAKLGDCAQIAQLFRQTIPAQLRPLTAVGQPGYSKYLEAQCKVSSFLPNNYLRVVEDRSSRRLLGCADFRLTEGTVGFLSYIAISADSRGRGLGSSLIDDFLSAHPGTTSLSLDVFSDNKPARLMYEKKGFRATDTRFWRTRRLPRTIDPVDLEILNAPLADAHYKRYGFTKFDALIGNRRTTVGLVGEQNVQAFDAETFMNPAFASAASLIAPKAKSIVFVGAPGAADVGDELAAKSIRMTWHLY